MLSQSIQQRIFYQRLAFLAVASVLWLLCMCFTSAHAEEAEVHKLTLTGLQVNHNGISSSFTITNSGTSSVFLNQSYRADSAPEIEVFSMSDQLNEPGGSRTYNLADMSQLPDSFRGFVVISSNQPLTGVVTSPGSALPTLAMTPTPTVIATATPEPTATTFQSTPIPGTTSTSTSTPDMPMVTDTPPADGATPFVVELRSSEAANGVFSRYRVTNLGSMTATQHHQFFDENGVWKNAFVSRLAANTSGEYDLGSPLRGFIMISSNQPIASVMLPTADFFPTRREGNPPFTVQFVDTSIGAYSSHLWDFGDGQTSTEVTPTHTYAVTGTYSVKLTVAGLSESNTITKSDLIKVHAFPPVHPDGWDLNFGDYGKVSLGDCQSSDFFVLSDGKIVVSATCGSYPDRKQYLLRYLPSGAIDISFGMNGRIQTNFGESGGRSNTATIAIQSDNKIVVGYGTLLTRFSLDGTVDTSFGTNGIADALATSDQHSFFTKLVMLSDDKILAAGRRNSQLIVARYTSNGTLDTSFNQVGFITLSIDNSVQTYDETSSWRQLAVQADGKILVGRSERILVDAFLGTYHFNIHLMRYKSNGEIDSSFGVGGSLSYGENNSEEILRQLFVLQDGNIILTVNQGDVIRLKSIGTFESKLYDGVVALLDSTDRLVLFTPSLDFFAATRYSTNGTIDTSFAQSGTLELGFLGVQMAKLQPDGNIIFGAYGSLSRYIESYPTPAPTTKPLTLLYAVLDNNLGEDATRLINNVEAGVRPGTNVRLLVDGPGENDVYLYNVMQDSNPFCPSVSNPTCDGRYAEGINFWHLANENSAHPDSLYQFLVDGVNAFTNTSSINVALIGHGSGWSANVLPGQPSIWRGQNDTLGGMLWDDHPGAGQTESRSLSTLMLGQALSWASAQSGRKIDLLYLDGCSMGMAEVAYEVRDSAKLLLASPNIDWASFNYNDLLPETATLKGQALGERWLALEANRLRSTTGYPFTLSLVDLGKMDELALASNRLANALQADLPVQHAAIGAAYQASDKFDSNYDGAINNQDSFVDLGDFAQQLAGQLPAESAVLSATQAVQSVLNTAIVAKEYENGTPWMFQDQQWAWNHYSGLAIYVPLGQDEARRQIFYNASNLSLAQDTNWDDFLASYWAGNVRSAATSMPVCHQTSDGCTGLANPLPVQPLRTIYLPLVVTQ